MKSSSIEANDDVDVDIVVGEERGAKKADTPIYNALKPSMRVIRLRHAYRSTAYALNPEHQLRDLLRKIW